MPSPDDDVIAAIRARAKSTSSGYLTHQDVLWLLDQLAVVTRDRDALLAAQQRWERDMLELIDERDQATEAADCLAYAIGDGEAIGEHSNVNDPWGNALDLLVTEREKAAVVTRERDELAATVRRVEMALLHAQSAREANLAVTAALRFDPDEERP